MEDDQGYVLGVFHKRIDTVEEFHGRLIHGAHHIPSYIIIVSHIDYQKVLFGGFALVFHQLCKFLDDSTLGHRATPNLSTTYISSYVLHRRAMR